jgi:DNA-directed RNA polymerase subunit RPC12/RpoP
MQIYVYKCSRCNSTFESKEVKHSRNCKVCGCYTVEKQLSIPGDYEKVFHAGLASDRHYEYMLCCV